MVWRKICGFSPDGLVISLSTAISDKQCSNVRCQEWHISENCELPLMCEGCGTVGHFLAWMRRKMWRMSLRQTGVEGRGRKEGKALVESRDSGIGCRIWMHACGIRYSWGISAECVFFFNRSASIHIPFSALKQGFERDVIPQDQVYTSQEIGIWGSRKDLYMGFVYENMSTFAVKIVVL